jgi:hypothetical protein
MRAKMEQSIEQTKQLQQLERTLWKIAGQHLSGATANTNLDSFQDLQRRSSEQFVSNTVTQCMDKIAKNYPLVEETQRQEILQRIIAAYSEGQVIAVVSDYKVTYNNFFFCADRTKPDAPADIGDTAATADTPNETTAAIGFKLHLSVDEEDIENLSRAWATTLQVARDHNIASFKMASQLTVEDKKGRQVTVYLHLPASQVSAFAEHILPGLVQAFSCRLAYERVQPDRRGMPDDCREIPGSRYVSYRCDAFRFSREEKYLSQDHLDCAQQVFKRLGSSSDLNDPHIVPLINDYMKKISLEYGEEFNAEEFIAEVQDVLRVAYNQLVTTGEISWHALQPRTDDAALGAALAACAVSPAALMRADCQGLRDNVRDIEERERLAGLEEPHARQTIENEEQAELDALTRMRM